MSSKGHAFGLVEHAVLYASWHVQGAHRGGRSAVLDF